MRVHVVRVKMATPLGAPQPQAAVLCATVDGAVTHEFRCPPSAAPPLGFPYEITVTPVAQAVAS